MRSPLSCGATRRVPYVTGVAVRRHVLAGYSGQRTHVSPRDIKRIALAPIVNAALAFASRAVRPERDENPEGYPIPFHTMVEDGVAWATYYDIAHSDEWRERGFDVPTEMVEAGKILAPRGRPQRGKSTEFYREIANAYRAFAFAGEAPVRAIARQKRIPENTVHQSIIRARKLGFLEPSPRSKRKELNDA